jgi:tRNA-dihydrouridine synthase B
MQKGFWSKLDLPIIGLSPMDGVTDAPMRFIAKKYGNPSIVYTEFVSAEGLWRIQKRGEMDHKIWGELKYDEADRPVIAQIFGSDPESFYEASKIVCGLGFDGIDINMGCPSPGLERRGGGAGLIRDKCNAVEVVEATRRGVEDYFSSAVTSIPVSLKTRIGSDKPDQKWWELLASMEMPAIAMHGRTFKQLYSGYADWELLLKAGEIIRESGALFMGNGDIRSIGKGEKFIVETSEGRKMDLTGKMDGVLVGRGAMGILG